MALETVDSIDLTRITKYSGIIMSGSYEDGRQTAVRVAMFSTLGEYVYGMLLAQEQESPDAKTMVMMPGFTSAWLAARVPREGVMELGSTTLDICTDEESLKSRFLSDEIQAAEWTPLPVNIVGLSVVYDIRPQALSRVREAGARA